MAFSKAFLVMMSLGRMPWRIILTTAAPARSQMRRLGSPTAGWQESWGSAMPMASMAEAMVLAVYMPPQEPAVGQALHSMAFNCSAPILPALYWPTASKMDTMSMSLPLYLP